MQNKLARELTSYSLNLRGPSTVFFLYRKNHIFLHFFDQFSIIKIKIRNSRGVPLLKGPSTVFYYPNNHLFYLFLINFQIRIRNSQDLKIRQGDLNIFEPPLTPLTRSIIIWTFLMGSDRKSKFKKTHLKISSPRKVACYQLASRTELIRVTVTVLYLLWPQVV